VGIIAFLVLAIIVALNLKSLGQWLRTSETLGDHNKYLLSATAQVLGALFALVFSITLIATQFVTKYTHRTMEIIFNKKVIAYMILFAGATVLPLGCLSNPTSLGAIISVIVGSIFVLSVPGFFWYLKGRMNIGWIITYLKEEGLRSLGNTKLTEENREGKAKENINALDNIGMGAFTDRNFEVFTLAEAKLTGLLLDIEKVFGNLKKRKLGKRLHDLVHSKLKDTCKEVIDNPRAPLTVIRQVRRVAVEAIKQNRSATWIAAKDMLVNIENLCDKDERLLVSDACARAIHEMAMNVPEKILDIKKRLPSDYDPTSDAYANAASPYFRLTQYELSIYDKHAQKEWWGLIKKDMERTAELIPSQIQNDQFYGLHILASLLGYFNFFLQKKKPSWADRALEIIGELIQTVIVKKKLPEIFIKLLVEGMPNYSFEGLSYYGEESLKKSKGVIIIGDIHYFGWQDMGGRIYGTVAYLATLALQGKRYKIVRATQKEYFKGIYSGELNAESMNNLISSLLKQTSLLLKFKPKELNERWVEDIIKALDYGFRSLIGRDYDKNLKELWAKFKQINKKLLKLALSKGNSWSSVVSVLDNFFQSFTWDHIQQEHPIPREELFRSIWLIKAVLQSFHKPLRLDSLADNLNRNQLAQAFFDEYQKAESEAQKMKKWEIPERLQEVRGSLREALAAMGIDIPPLTS